MPRWAVWLAIVCVVGLLGRAGATDYRLKADEIGTLQTCSTSCTTGTGQTGQAGDTVVPFVQVNGSARLIFQFVFAGTAAGAVENSIDNGVTWTVEDSFTATATSPQKLCIADPVGWYRTNVTTCTGCGPFATRYYAAPRGLH